jgi:hypothetical protein
MILDAQEPSRRAQGWGLAGDLTTHRTQKCWIASCTRSRSRSIQARVRYGRGVKGRECERCRASSVGGVGRQLVKNTEARERVQPRPRRVRTRKGVGQRETDAVVTGHHGRVYGGTLQARANLTLFTHHPFLPTRHGDRPQTRAFSFGHSGSGRPNARWQEEGRGRPDHPARLLHRHLSRHQSDSTESTVYLWHLSCDYYWEWLI